MELLQIIIFTLKLFALTSAIIVLISYFIFKLKDRNRIKPYMKQTSIDLSNNLAAELSIPNEDKNKIKSNRFKILNEESAFFINQQKDISNGSSINYIQKNLLAATNNFHIYDYYAKSKFEPMHKIKL